MAKQFNKNSPHDKLIKKVFDIREFTLAFIQDHMPWFWEQVKNEAERISETFVDEATLRALQCDIALKMLIESLDGPRTAFIIMEHKSYRDEKALLQLAKYIIALLERLAEGNLDGLKAPPVIIPLLLYHGKKKWDMLEELDTTMFDGEGATGMNIKFACINLSEMSKEQLSSNIHLRGILYAMLYACRVLDDGPLNEEDLLDDVLSTLLADDGQPLAETIVGYIIGTGRTTRAAVEASLRRIKSKRGEVIVDKAWMEGLRESEAKGKAEGEAKVLAQQLQHKFGSVPSSVQERLEQAVPEELEAWSLRIFDAKSPEAIFAD